MATSASSSVAAAASATRSEALPTAAHGLAPLTRFTLVHAFAWLAAANLIGTGLALLLLFPNAAHFLAPLTYGRWMPVHMNAELYGWTALPLVAWLFALYRVERPGLATAARAAIWLWSISLALGALDWLQGEVSGKLFLDWTGYPRVLFPTAIAFLWLVLAVSLFDGSHRLSRAATLARGFGLLPLAAVPALLYLAPSARLYPPINPDSGGPTGSSQLESSLIIVLILMLLPWALAARSSGEQKQRRQVNWVTISWVVFAVEALFSLALSRGDLSNHLPGQALALFPLLLWVPLIPLYYQCFAWPRAARLWLWSVYAWWALLVPAGCVLFLPGVLDRLKFTDALVSHSILAMAGFVSSLLLLVAVVLLGPEGERLDSPWSFWTWNLATLAYVLLFAVVGWIEGAHPAFTIVPGTARNLVYSLRLLQGIAMTAAGIDWLLRLIVPPAHLIHHTAETRAQAQASVAAHPSAELPSEVQPA